MNKISVLDKGYVNLVSSVNNTKQLRLLKSEFFNNKWEDGFLDIARMTVEFKCPLFVQLNLHKYMNNILVCSQSKPSAYVPDVSEINSGDHGTDKTISEDMEVSTEALLINPWAYQKDGCDQFISQVMTPISVYNRIVVEGSLKDWLKFAGQSNLPKPIEAYVNHIKGIIDTEWMDLNDMIMEKVDGEDTKQETTGQTSS